MIRILHIETSSTNCSVALSEDGQCIDCIENNAETYNHSELLHEYIKTLLQRNNRTFSSLNAIALSAGPGSYTGLRIGSSTAKGLCFALEIPLIALSTLEIITHPHTTDYDVIVPMVDARRSEVYAAVYAGAKELKPARPIELNTESFSEYLNMGRVLFCGSGAKKFKVISKSTKAAFDSFEAPTAKNAVLLAYEKFQQKAFEDTAYFTPFYLKEFKTSVKKLLYKKT